MNAVLRPAGGVGLFFHPRSSVFICGSNAFRPSDHRISNRNIPRLEPHVTPCKQTAATESNRNKTRHCDTHFPAAFFNSNRRRVPIRNGRKSLSKGGRRRLIVAETQ